MAESAEYQKLQEAVAAQAALNQRLLERAIRSDAREEGARLLAGVTLPAAAKLKVIEACIERGVPTKDGELDTAKFQESITAEAQSMGRFLSELTGSGQVRGMGIAPVDPVQLAESRKRQAEESTQLRESAENVFSILMGGDKAAAKAAAGKGQVA